MFHYFSFILFIIYIVGMTAFMIWQGIGIAPDRYAFVLLLPALLFQRTRAFLLDWIPFLFILISYDFLRSFADTLGQKVHVQELIDGEIAIFGNLPTVELQAMLYHPGNLQWYDYYLTIFYFLHFALPLAFGYMLWIRSRGWFQEFIVAILLLSYAGWISYMIYPAAPPWLAEQDGYITGVTKILDQTLNVFPEKISLPTIYHQFTPNQVAAMPSMHAAYPFLVLLFLYSYFRWKAAFFIPYVASVWLAIIYLGEHYVIDVIAGAIYALIFFLLTKWLFKHKQFFIQIGENIQKKVNSVLPK